MGFRGPVLSIAVVAGLVACAGVEGGASPPEPQALAGEWRVEDLDGRGVLDRVPLTVAFADGRVSAFAGCNRISGDFAQAGGRVTVGPLVSTRMACSPALMEQERRLTASLQAAGTLAQAGEGAVRLSGPGGLSLLLRPADVPVRATPGMALRCGEQDFRIAFREEAAQLTRADGSVSTLPRQSGQGRDPEAPQVFTDGRITLTREIEGGRAITFAFGRMAPVRCDPADG